MAIRRTAAVLLGLLFFLLFTAGILRAHASGTLLNPEYIKTELERVQLYAWAHEHLFPIVVEERVTERLEVEASFPRGEETRFEVADMDAARRTGLEMARETAPPGYLQNVTESAVDQAIPYVRGESESVQIPLSLNERVNVLFPSMNDAYGELGVSQTLSDELIAPAVEQFSRDFTSGPLGVTLTDEQAREAAERIFPEEWLDRHALRVLEGLEAYADGSNDTARVHIEIKDRLPEAASVAKEVVSERETERVLFDRLIKREVRAAVGEVTVLSYEVPVTDEDITLATRAIAPPEWVRGHMNGIIDEVAAYLAGEEDEISYTVRLSDRKSEATDAIAGIAVDKADAALSSLPDCRSQAEAGAAAGDLSAGRLPRCNPEAAVPDRLFDRARERVVAETREVIGERFPESVTYGVEDFTSDINPELEDDLAALRDSLAGGLTFTHQDAREMLVNNGADPGDLDLLIDLARTGRPYTLDDMEAQGNIDAETLKSARQRVSRALSPFATAGLFAAGLGLLAGIGMLGSHSWPMRLIWAAGALAVSALLVATVVPSVVSGFAGGQVEGKVNEALEERFREREAAGESAASLELARDEIVPYLRSAVDAWAGGLRGAAFPWLVLGAFGTGAALVWWHYGPFTERENDPERDTCATRRQVNGLPGSPGRR